MEIKIRETSSIQSSQDTFDIIQRIFYKRHKKVDLHKEHFWTIAMNRSLKILCVELVSIGSNSQTLAEPQEIFRLPIYKHASRVVLIHNHPSGSLQPSESDLDTTNRLIQAGLIFGIKVVDHVITTKHSYFSFMDNGLIEKLRWDRKYALTFIRDKQVAEEVEKIKSESKQYQKAARKEGKLEGIKEGVVKGAKAEKREIAKSMLIKGMDAHLIEEITGLSPSWIDNLKAEMEQEKGA